MRNNHNAKKMYVRSSTMEPGAINVKQQRDHVISARARLYRKRGCIASAR